MHEVKYIRPKSLADAVQIYRTTPGCRPLAGGTDLMVMLHARTLRPEPRAVLDLWSLAELKGVRRARDMLEIGAAESYTGIIASRDVQQHLPALAAASARSERRKSRTAARSAATWRTRRPQGTRCPCCSPTTRSS